MSLTVITDPRCAEYWMRGHPERPERITRTVEWLRAQKDVALAWAAPRAADDEAILRVHTPGHLQAVESESDFDADTPAYPGIPHHARRSAGGALDALERARRGERAFSLLRPPGHHATAGRAMGFCYLNSVAVAAHAAQAAGCRRVAVFDFDVHHGNGTEEILLDKDGFGFFSIHQYPAYPGTGAVNRGRNCFNYPVAPFTPRANYRAVIERAFEDLKKFQPDMIAVSAGFDAYSGDPLANGTLEAEDFQWIGTTLARLGVPSFHVLEGGYSDELPQLIAAYLRGLLS